MCVLNWWINSDITSTFQTSPTSGLKFRSINTSTHGWELLGKLPLVSWTNSIILLDLSLFPSCISLRGPEQEPEKRGKTQPQTPVELLPAVLTAPCPQRRPLLCSPRPTLHEPTMHPMPHSACHPATTHQPLLWMRASTSLLRHNLW